MCPGDAPAAGAGAEPGAEAGTPGAFVSPSGGALGLLEGEAGATFGFGGTPTLWTEQREQEGMAGAPPGRVRAPGPLATPSIPLTSSTLAAGASTKAAGCK